LFSLSLSKEKESVPIHRHSQAGVVGSKFRSIGAVTANRIGRTCQTTNHRCDWQVSRWQPIKAHCDAFHRTSPPSITLYHGINKTASTSSSPTGQSDQQTHLIRLFS